MCPLTWAVLGPGRPSCRVDPGQVPGPALPCPALPSGLGLGSTHSSCAGTGKSGLAHAELPRAGVGEPDWAWRALTCRVTHALTSCPALIPACAGTLRPLTRSLSPAGALLTPLSPSRFPPRPTNAFFPPTSGAQGTWPGPSHPGPCFSAASAPRPALPLGFSLPASPLTSPLHDQPGPLFWDWRDGIAARALGPHPTLLGTL